MVSHQLSYLDVDMTLTKVAKDVESVLPPELGDPVRFKGRCILTAEDGVFTLTWIRNEGRLYSIEKVE